ncbi:MAG: hypothetical protein HY320_10860 [Armatimonadetes bacterium]|nr:hypothetical protein [Armatimonadota bacterium]
MWYPEAPVLVCNECEEDIPLQCLWRGRGLVINRRGSRCRTWILYAWCPRCGSRQSTGLDGPPWYRLVYGWLWQIRYPARRPPDLFVFDLPIAQPEERRAAG